MFSWFHHLYVCRDDLFPLADLVTPNLPEASAIIGGDPVTTVAEMREAAEAIHQLGPRLAISPLQRHSFRDFVPNLFPEILGYGRISLVLDVMFLVLFDLAGMSS